MRTLFFRAPTLAAGVITAGMMGGVPAPTVAQTLQEAMETAISTSPDIDQQRAALRALDEAVAIARSGFRPSFTGNFSAGANFSENSEQLPGADRWTYPTSVGATVTQSIYDGGQTSNAVDGAFATVEGGRFTLLSVQQQVLLNTVTAYVNVVQAQQNVELAEKSQMVLRRQLQAARDRFSVGETTRTDVSQAEAALAEARANLATQRGLLGQARETYRQVVGEMPGSLAPLPPLPQLPNSLEEAQEIALRNHPDILSARANVEAASFAVREAIGATLPSVDFSASWTSGSDTINRGSGANTGSFAITGSVPFYVGGSLRAQVRSAQAAASQARAQLRATTRRVLQDVGVAWEILVASRATIRANIAQIEAERVAFNGVVEEARVGQRTTLDVLEAEEDLLDAETSLVVSRADEYVNAYTLLAAMGLLTVEAIDLSVEHYDVEGPYAESQEFTRGYDDDEDTEWRYNWRP